MPDMLVSLLHLPDAGDLYQSLEKKGIRIQRAMTPDKLCVVKWVNDHFGPGFAGECDAAFSHHPVSCFLAVQDHHILGFACYNATYPDFFGPTAVLESQRGSGIGKALLIRSLESMRDYGYAYAIIGGVGPAEFYTKCVGATLIPDSSPGIYRDLIGSSSEESASVSL
jgi:GNAT superfamily N-acetyltransferase